VRSVPEMASLVETLFNGVEPTAAGNDFPTASRPTGPVVPSRSLPCPWRSATAHFDLSPAQALHRRPGRYCPARTLRPAS